MSTTEADDPVTTAKPRRAMSLPVVAVLACAILLSLLGLQLALKLPGGQGIEDLLGWTHTVGNSPVVYLQPGDGPASYADPNVRRLIRNAIGFVGTRPQLVK